KKSKSAEPKNVEAKKPFKFTRQHKMLLGSLLVLFSVALLLSFISFFIYGQADQSAVQQITDRTETTRNWLGKIGAYLADFFIYRGFGAASFLFVKLFFLTGAFLVLDIPLKRLRSTWFWDIFVMIVASILFGFFATSLPELGGVIGYEMNDFFQDYLGKTGTLLLLIFGIIIYLIFKIQISPDAIKSLFERKSAPEREVAEPAMASSMEYNLEEFAVKDEEPSLEPEPEIEDEFIPEPELKPSSRVEVNREALQPTIGSASELKLDPEPKKESAPVHHHEPEIIQTGDEAFV